MHLPASEVSVREHDTWGNSLQGYRCRCLHTVAATLGSVQTLWSYVHARLSNPSLCWDAHTSLVWNAYFVAHMCVPDPHRLLCA